MIPEVQLCIFLHVKVVTVKYRRYCLSKDLLNVAIKVLTLKPLVPNS